MFGKKIKKKKKKIRFEMNEKSRNRLASLFEFNVVTFISDNLEIYDEAILQVVMPTLKDTGQYDPVYGYMIPK